MENLSIRRAFCLLMLKLLYLEDALKTVNPMIHGTRVHQRGARMKRDMELMRKILFAIEDEYKPGKGFMFGLKIEGYDMMTIAEHCDLLFQQGLIKDYNPTFGGDQIQLFRIGNLTALGYDYLELIRNDEVWEKTKTEIETKRRPNTLEEIMRIAGVFVGNVIKELNG